MADIVRDIVDRLNALPFNKELTLIGFDAMSPDQLIQTLNMILAHIAPDHDIDVRQELPDDRVVRMLSLLRVLKYKPNISKSEMAAGLLEGKPDVIHPIMHWTLTKLSELKKRAYLANFLMTIEVPPEMLQNDEVTETREQYLTLIETFKEVHKEVEAMRTSGLSVDEVKNDIKHMEKEKDQLQKRVSRLQQKYEGVSNYKSMLNAAKELRQQMEREQELVQLREDQIQQRSLSEERLQRAMNLLREARANAIRGGADEVIKHIEEEVRMKRYLNNEKLPGSIKEKSKACTDARRILDEPVMSSDDLSDLHTQIQRLTRDTNALTEERMNAKKSDDNNLPMFHQQAAIISRKKERTAERLKDLEDELNKLEKEHTEKRQLMDARGPRMLKADEFKRYVAKLRTKSTVYKQKKNELAAAQAEVGILTRTIEILQENEQNARARLAVMEEQQGVSGVTEAQAKLEDVSVNKSELDSAKGKTLEEISALVEQLNEKINSKRAELAPAIKHLRSLRSKDKELKARYEQKKSEFDHVAANLESNKSSIESEVKALREEVSIEESRFHYLHVMMDHMNKQLQRAQKEMRVYLGQEVGTSLRDIINKKIQEQERTGQQLRARQQELKESFDENIHQMDMWRDLETLFKCKVECLTRETRGSSQDRDGVALEEQDRLVLA